MSTTIVERPLMRRVSWGALFAGFFIGVGIWMMLLMLISAIGFSSVDPRNLGSWGSFAEGVGIWGGIAGIIASFCGAWCAGRLCGTSERGEGMLHGVAVWGLALSVALWVAAMVVGGAVTGAASAVGGAVSAAGNAAPAAASEVSPQQMQQAGQQAQSSLAQAQQAAPEVARQAGQAAARGGKAAAWGGFIFVALTFIAAILGGAAAVTGERRRRVTDERVPARPLTPQEV